jgi:hypothetical protein
VPVRHDDVSGFGMNPNHEWFPRFLAVPAYRLDPFVQSADGGAVERYDVGTGDCLRVRAWGMVPREYRGDHEAVHDLAQTTPVDGARRIAQAQGYALALESSSRISVPIGVCTAELRPAPGTVRAVAGFFKPCCIQRHRFYHLAANTGKTDGSF